jgi:hypothetical protein
MNHLLLCALTLTFGQGKGEIELLGEASLPGTASDLSGMKGKLKDGTPADRLGGLGSGIAYSGTGSRYLLISDRGPKDGAVPYPCRFHALDITITPGARQPVVARLTATTLLTDEKGRHLNGAQDDLEMRYDPEAIRVGPTGTVFLSDEYGPDVSEFDAKGKRLRRLPVPERFRPEKPASTPDKEMPPRNNRGRQPNRGLEGLAISPDGKKLYAILQSPLIQDGGLSKEGKRAGLNCRILEIDTESLKTRELVYPLTSSGNGVCEILAVNESQFLVLERDSHSGKDAKAKRVYLIDISDATDVSKVDALPSGKLPAEVKPVSKKLFLDLLDPKWGLAGKDLPEKIEGLAFGPSLRDGRIVLLVTADNDFIAERPLRIFAFAISRPALPGYKPQAFKKADK